MKIYFKKKYYLKHYYIYVFNNRRRKTQWITEKQLFDLLLYVSGLRKSKHVNKTENTAAKDANIKELKKRFKTVEAEIQGGNFAQLSGLCVWLFCFPLMTTVCRPSSGSRPTPASRSCKMSCPRQGRSCVLLLCGVWLRVQVAEKSRRRAAAAATWNCKK